MNTTQRCMATTFLALVACSSGKHDFDGLGNSRDGGTKTLTDGKVVVEDVCGKHIVKSDHAVPDMLIVLDKSGSMAPGGNATRTDRWTGSRDAVDEVTAMFDATINFGLMTFPGAGGGGGGGGGGGINIGGINIGGGGGGGGGGNLASSLQCSAGKVDVAIGPSNGAAISQALRPMSAAGYTPTAATLTAALDVIGTPQSADQNVSSSKYILLVTDGDPNCSKDYTGQGGQGNVAPADPTARADTLAAIKKLTEAGVQTYVVGFQTATTNFASVLDMMAEAGGTGETKHTSVESGDELSSVFQTLAGQAASCTYHLAMPVDESQVTVSVGGKKKDFKNSADGWILSGDGQTVTLTGAACDAAKKGNIFTVEVSCDLVIGI